MGWTALIYAAENGRDKVVEVLLSHGAKTDIKDEVSEKYMLVTTTGCLILRNMSLALFMMKYSRSSQKIHYLKK